MMDDDAVDDCLDGVDLVAVQCDLIVNGIDCAVNAYADESGLADIFQNGLIGPFAGAYDGCHHHDAGPVRKGCDGIGDLFGRLFGDFPSADRAVGNADAGKHQAEIVIDLGDRPYGGTGIARGAFLIDRNRGRKSFDDIYIGFVHLPQKLPGIGRQGFDVTPLPFRKDRVKCQGRFSGTGKSGDHC